MIQGVGSSWQNSDIVVFGLRGTADVTVTLGGSLLTDSASVGSTVLISGDPGATVTIDDDASTWSNTGDLSIGAGGRHGAVTISDGASVVTGSAQLAPSLSTSTASLVLDGPGSSFTSTSSVSVGGSFFAAGGTATVDIGFATTLDVGGTLTIWDQGTVNLNGGTINTAALVFAGSTFNFNFGTLNITGDVLYDSLLQTDIFGSLASPIGIAQDFRIGGVATLVTPLTIDGGSFSVGTLVNPGFLQFNSGQLNFTGAGGLTVGPGGDLGSVVTVTGTQSLGVTNTATIDPAGLLVVEDGGAFSANLIANNGEMQLAGNTARVDANSITNVGTILGDGRVNATLLNQATGAVLVGTGERLVFTSASNTNSGGIEVQDGRVEFLGDLTNNSGGTIDALDADVRFNGGLTNNGALNFSTGQSQAFGDINITATGRISVGGSSLVTIFGDIDNEGDVIVASGSTLVLPGDVTGSGNFPSAGTVEFLGSLIPGSSPAEITFGGNVVLAGGATLAIELGGLAKGSEFDALTISGEANIAGVLDVNLIDAFVPSIGNEFEILTADGGIQGEFDLVSLPAISPGLFWNVDYGATALTLSVVDFILGDMTGDGLVNLADVSAFIQALVNRPAYDAQGYVTNTDAAGDIDGSGTFDLGDTALFSGLFGGPASASAQAVPEPTTLSLAVVLLIGIAIRQRRCV